MSKALGEWGLSLKQEDVRPFAAMSLARWLRDCAAKLGKNDVAVTAAGAAFEHTCRWRIFESAKVLAGAKRPDHRHRLAAFLMAAQYARDRTGIFSTKT